MKNKILYLSMFFILLFTYFIFANGNKVLAAEEVDMVLFWGQSNMLGSCGKYAENKENKKDKRNLSGKIDEDIINEMKRMNYVAVDVPSGAAYEYKFATNSLEEITSKTKYFGENLKYNAKKGKLTTSSFYSSK